VFVLKSGFLTYLLGEQLPSSPYTFLTRQIHFTDPSQNSLEQKKEMTFDRRLLSITDLVFRGLYCPSTKSLLKKALQEITAISQR